jgi:cytosine/adenosine deaminase-related metal-dependent hydrolase
MGGEPAMNRGRVPAAIERADVPVLIRCRAIVGTPRPADTLLLEFEDGKVGSGPVVARRVRVLAVGPAAEVAGHPAASRAHTLDLSGHVILPGLVNAHTHLDLTHVGPRPCDHAAGFVGWIDMVRSARRIDGEGIRASVRRGVGLSLAGGVVAVGDVAGAAGRPRLEPWEELSAAPLAGVSYLEFFAIGTRQAQGLHAAEQALEQARSGARGSVGVRLGLQPHAPYTVSPAAYRWAMEQASARGLPLSTHLAESSEEHRLVSRGEGPLRQFLEDLGIWSEELASVFGGGSTPVAHVASAWEGAASPPALAVVHVNDASDRDVEILARLAEHRGLVVIYCPRASAYFRHEERFGPHPYRTLLEAGVPVALGTDSVISLPAGSSEEGAGRISTLDEMRLLFRRDGTDPCLLLSMATTVAARALGMSGAEFEFRAGASVRGVVAVEAGPAGSASPAGDAVADVLRVDTPPRLLAIADGSG